MGFCRDMNKIIYRLIFDIVIFIAVINGWWLPALFLAIVGFWIFPYYVELIITGIAYDALFGMVPSNGFLDYAGSTITIVFTVVLVFLKRVVR